MRKRPDLLEQVRVTDLQAKAGSFLPGFFMSGEQDLGPPEMRRPSGKLGRHKVSMEWTTIDTNPAPAQLSSDLLRLACAALSAEELAERICSHTGLKSKAPAAASEERRPS
jgi:hypothetical protein